MAISARRPRVRVKRSSAWPSDYHAYIFQDGKLLGAFDDMYRHAAGVPWDQDTRCNRWYTNVGMLMLQEHAPYDSILEIGCGLGYITAKLKTLTKGPLEAFDVSPSAIHKATRLQRGMTCYVDDITARDFKARRPYHLVVVKDLLWYVGGSVPTVIQRISSCVRRRGKLYLCQSFPRLDRPFVGNESIPNPDALMSLFREFEPLYTARLRNHRFVDDGPMLHFLGEKRG